MEAEGWVVALCLPPIAFAAIACYAAAAGCYALFMNCFSVVQPESWLTGTMFFAAKLAPFGFPTAAMFAVAGLVVLFRSGAERLRRWLWIGPVLFAAALHVACVAFAWTALPQRQIQPTALFDVVALVLAYAYAALVWLAQASRRRASSRW
jgi:hypothetical protein